MSNNDVNTDDVKKMGGLFSRPNDDTLKTIVVALLLCLVCSIVVSTAAIFLKPQQTANKLEDKKKNILSVAGIEVDGQSIDTLFEQIEVRVVDFSIGDYTDAVDAATFDQRKASKDSAYRVELSKQQDLALIGGRSKYGNVYLVKDGDTVSKIILPIKGYGLWSTLYGFLCLEGDANTTCGISFYEHGETPGLGGEIENKKWQASWVGKKVADASGQPQLRLIKGVVSENTADADYKIDGLAGATLTSKGVSNLIKFWTDKDGYGPYLTKIRRQFKSRNSQINTTGGN